MMWLRIETPRAVGALRFNDAGFAVEGAPYFIKFLGGESLAAVQDYCAKRKWRTVKLEQVEIPWELE